MSSLTNIPCLVKHRFLPLNSIRLFAKCDWAAVFKLSTHNAGKSSCNLLISNPQLVLSEVNSRSLNLFSAVSSSVS